MGEMDYDVTVRFCDRYIDKRSRTHDQMVRAARSGVQDIAEGSKASGASKKMELKLTNVARASLEELRLDYEDYLRQRSLALWAKDDPRRAKLVARRCATAEAVAWSFYICPPFQGNRSFEKASPRFLRQGVFISSYQTPCGPPCQGGQTCGLRPALLRLQRMPRWFIGVACALLDCQLEAQAEAFVEEGGFTERLYRVRTAMRHRGASR